MWRKFTREKAVEFYQKFTGKNDFRAGGDTRLGGFRNRYGIRLSAITDSVANKSSPSKIQADDEYDTY